MVRAPGCSFPHEDPGVGCRSLGHNFRPRFDDAAVCAFHDCGLGRAAHLCGACSQVEAPAAAA